MEHVIIQVVLSAEVQNGLQQLADKMHTNISGVITHLFHVYMKSGSAPSEVADPEYCRSNVATQTALAVVTETVKTDRQVTNAVAAAATGPALSTVKTEHSVNTLEGWLSQDIVVKEEVTACDEDDPDVTDAADGPSQLEDSTTDIKEELLEVTLGSGTVGSGPPTTASSSEDDPDDEEASGDSAADWPQSSQVVLHTAPQSQVKRDPCDDAENVLPWSGTSVDFKEEGFGADARVQERLSGGARWRRGKRNTRPKQTSPAPHCSSTLTAAETEDVEVEGETKCVGILPVSNSDCSDVSEERSSTGSGGGRPSGAVPPKNPGPSGGPETCEQSGARSLTVGRSTEQVNADQSPQPEHFKCGQCNAVFLQSKHLKNHMETHLRPFKCDICGFGFKRMDHVERHMLTHTGAKPHQCDQCGVKFRRVSQLSLHKLTHTGGKPVKCKECGAQFVEKSGLRKHLLIHTGERKHICSHCGAKFRHFWNLKQHTLTHVKEKSYECDSCGDKFRQQASLNRHKLIHSGGKPYECNVCGVGFRDTKQLNEHKRVHTGEKPHECNHCDAKFSQVSALRRHELIHTEKPYTCYLCNAKFKEAHSLYQHNLTHIGEIQSGKKSHTCNQCGAKFSRLCGLSRHFLTHTGEKPYECDVCSARFRDKSNLMQHKRTHTGERPNEGGPCGSAASLGQN